ncbi:MAG: hypothetical protein KIT83_10585 [Bryobacterales bacterium]|nr:hypothetical protein [Bryobacterales bacterium]
MVDYVESEANVDMDLYAVLAHLVAERKRIDDLIRALEALQEKHAANGGDLAQSRRGRKFMSPEERQEVSRRMQRYWEGRRAAQSNAQPDENVESE